MSLFTFVQLSSQRISDKKTGQDRTAARTAHSTLAVDERCCRAGGTSPKVVETILCAGPNLPPTIRIVVNVSAKKTVETCLQCLTSSAVIERGHLHFEWLEICTALYSYKSTQCHVISLFPIEKNCTFYLESDKNVEIKICFGLRAKFSRFRILKHQIAIFYFWPWDFLIFQLCIKIFESKIVNLRILVVQKLCWWRNL